MATVSFNIDNADVADYTDAFGEGYRETINGSPNPETKAQFAKRMVAETLAMRVEQFRKEKAQKNLVVVRPNIT